MSADIVVSVAMTTYNQERFIAQAIESVILQETDFPVELVIGEDCSTDGTRSIVQNYAAKYPDRIKAILHPRNLGPTHSPGKHNFISVLDACTGQYIAVLEGDDYWTDPHKLQKQVKFLEAHPECAICFHDVMVAYENQQRESHRFCPPDQKEISTLEDLLDRNFIPTCSVMYRRGTVSALPGWFCEVLMGDWPLHILHAVNGQVGYMALVMGVYRIHQGGEWTKSDSATRVCHRIQFYGLIRDQLPSGYESIVKRRARDLLNNLASHYAAAIVESQGDQRLLGDIASTVQLLRNPPYVGVLPRLWRRYFYGNLYLEASFLAHRRACLPLTQYCLRRSVRFRPEVLVNMRVWSIALDAWVR